MMRASELQYIDTKEMPLEEWLTLLFNPPSGKQFTDWAFPTPEHRQEYLASIHQRPEDQVYRLLQEFLIPSTTMGCDKRHLAMLKAIQTGTSETSRRFSQYDKRLILYFAGHSPIPPWEGITWILDLLPHFPRQALEGLRAYILAHAQELPDGRYIGLYDASEVIRAKFIGVPGTKSEKIQFLLDLQPRDFECLVERLYHSMDYETMLTAARKDGGRDIIATKQAPGKLEHLRIECKRYSGPVGVKIVRSLLGVVSDEKVNKGVLVTTSRFTGPAQKLANRNPRLELIAGNQLIPLMNEYLGPSWPLHIDRLVVASQSQQTALVAKE